jgi:hypothetical protein
MKNWTKSAVAVGLGSLLAAPAMATQSRINSLSAGGTTFGDLTSVGNPVFNEKLITIRDSANILYFPQYLAAQPAAGSESKSPLLYGNSVDVDNVAATSYGLMNVRYALSDSAVLWLYGRRSPWAPVTTAPSILGGTAAAAAGYKSAAADPTNHQLGVGFGMRSGESMRLGASLSIGGASADGAGPAGTQASPMNQNGNLLIDTNLGLGFDMGDNALDFGLNLNFGSFNNFETLSQNLVSYKPNGILGLAFLAKGEFQVQQTARLVPFLRVGYTNQSIAHDARGDQPCPPTGPSCDGPKLGNNSSVRLNLGTDLALRPLDKVLIQPGVGIGYRTSMLSGNSLPQTQPGVVPQELTLENSSQVLGYYGFAAEANAFDWMVLRVGARQTVTKNNFASTVPPAPAGQQQLTNEAHASTVTNVVSTGVGFNLKEWVLDLNVNPAFFNNGPHALTGVATNPFAVDFALTYKWP